MGGDTELLKTLSMSVAKSRLALLRHGALMFLGEAELSTLCSRLVERPMGAYLYLLKIKITI